MSTHNTVEVYLGNPIPVASEREFLARLRHDLLKLGVTARSSPTSGPAGRSDRSTSS
jgi:hypothetical protein